MFRRIVDLVKLTRTVAAPHCSIGGFVTVTCLRDYRTKKIELWNGKEFIRSNTLARVVICDVLMKELHCDSDAAKRLLEENPELRTTNLARIKLNTALLLGEGLLVADIVADGWLLTMDSRKLISAYTQLLITPAFSISGLLKNKIKILSQLMPNRLADCASFLKLTQSQLYHIQRQHFRDADIVPGGNRILYFSEQMGIEPKLVAKRFARWPFMYYYDFEHVRERLKLQLENNVKPEHILLDLHGFRAPCDKIEMRLGTANEEDLKRIRPWKINCWKETLDM